MKINQFHSGTALGDAITNQMLSIRDLLVSEGYESEIYAEFIADGLKGSIKDIHSYPGDKDAILLVHHSMGFGVYDKIISLPDRKVLIYHNITPERFFSDENIKREIRRGLRQVREYKNHVDYAIADSNYNRKALLSMGYRQVDVMPVHISLSRFDTVKSDSEFAAQYEKTRNLLFVGRVVPNKRQDDLIRIFACYTRHFEPESRLLLAGDLSQADYVAALKALAEELGIAEKVMFLGKISESELKACYEVADVYISMSEHEGFGVPLLEAMKMGVPVIAYASSAIPETMGNAGVLVTEKRYEYIAALVDEIIRDAGLREKLVQSQYKRIERLEATDTRKVLLKAIDNIQKGGRKRTIQLQGPFETSYSLAIVNRKLIEAIDDVGTDDVSIYCTEGPGDYEPKPEDLKDKPHAKALWEKSKDVQYPDVTIRNMYPPRVSDVCGGLNFQAFAWEESEVPRRYVEQFNTYLNGVGTTSEFVTRALKESGLKIPVATMGNGVELPKNFDKLPAYPLKTKKRVKFLHISSAFPRKGVDVLLKAYFEAFTNEDDVCLVLKTFDNPHNEVQSQLEALKRQYPNAPEVEWINGDMPENELFGLYKAADCYVHVARGEGFGLPVAEAMLAKIPVIVSPNTGLADFCNVETAILIDYEMVPAQSHVSTENSLWAEPNQHTLTEKLRQFVMQPESLDIEAKVRNAYRLISEEFSWDKVARRWLDFIDEVQRMQDKPQVALVTTWNHKCGIAEYSRLQFEAMRNAVDFTIYPNSGVMLIRPDEDFVAQRMWRCGIDGDIRQLTEALDQSLCSVVHIQFHMTFFELGQLSQLIRALHDKKRIIITFHKTNDEYSGGKQISLKSVKDALNLCYRLIVHQEEDRNRLIEYGVNPDIIQIIPHGQIVFRDYGKNYLKKKLELQRSLVLGSYGFILPNKGIRENIEALAIIKKSVPDVLYLVCCARHESSVSAQYLAECKELVTKLGLESNVVFITDFLPNDESIVLLQCCDVLLMTYLPSPESASGAVRFCIAAKRPLITTDQPIFAEFADCTYQIPEADPKLIAEAVMLMRDKEQSAQYMEKLERHIEQTRWETVCKTILSLYK